MISLSKIVKSVSVVDDRPPERRTLANVIEEGLPKMSVIKRDLFEYRENPYADPTSALPDRQGYIDELNRVKVEIAQAKAELRSLGRLIEETVEEQNLAAGAPQDTMSGAEGLAIAQAEAERLMRETRENAEAMMEGYRTEGQRLAEEARNRGYLEGFDQGFAQAQEEFRAQGEPRMRELASLLEQISNYREEMIAQNERELVELVITAAEKIIGREIKNDPRAVASMLYKTLDANRREEDIRITISPELMPADAKVGADLIRMITQIAPSASVQVDEEAEAGTCFVETGKGITDISVKTQLKNIEDILSE